MSGRDPCTLERVAGAQRFAFGRNGYADFPGFLHEALFYFRTYVYTIFFCFLQDILRTLCAGAQTTDSNSNSSAESVLQPAGYIATRRALLIRHRG